MAKIYSTTEMVNGQLLKVEKNDRQQYMSFIDTGLKFHDQKVYEGFMFLQDSDRIFKGYFYKSNTKELVNVRGRGLCEKTSNKTFTSFSKSVKLSWSEWYDLMSNNNEVCSGKVRQIVV